MKDIRLYYFFLIAPLFLIYILKDLEIIDTYGFIFLIFFYSLVYRTFLDGRRLAGKNIIPASAVWKLILPGQRLRYFKELYCK